MDHSYALDVAVEAAHAAGSVLRRYFRQEGLEVRSKGPNDYVTTADEESETIVLDLLRSHFPDHALLSEEQGAMGEHQELAWVIDPLDGTNNFVQGLPFYCVSIALCHFGVPIIGVIFDPEGGNLFTARVGGGAYWNGRSMSVSDRQGLEGAFIATGFPFRAQGALGSYLRTFEEIFCRVRALRRCGAAALDLAYTAAGVYDGYFEFGLSPWDVAAGALMVGEAGGRVSDLDGGDQHVRTGNVVAGTPGLWAELREQISQHVDRAAVESVAASAGPVLI